MYVHCHWKIIILVLANACIELVSEMDQTLYNKTIFRNFTNYNIFSFPSQTFNEIHLTFMSFLKINLDKLIF